MEVQVRVGFTSWMIKGTPYRDYAGNEFTPLIPQQAFKGDIVEIPDETAESLLASGDVQEPESAPLPGTVTARTPFSAPAPGEQYPDEEPPPQLAATEAAARAPLGEEFDPSEGTVEELTTWILSTSPTVTEMTDAAGDDPDVAERLLEAERSATGGKPRKGVVASMESIMEEEEE